MSLRSDVLPSGAAGPAGPAGSAGSAGSAGPAGSARSTGPTWSAGGATDRPPIPAKIVVSGGFGVGKTTFIGALSEIEPLTTEAEMTTAAVGIDEPGPGSRKTTTTVAMDFGRISIDESILLYMFGTPGQDRFGFMWNDLTRGALGGVILVDTTRIEDCFVALDYFERVGLPFVVAVNQFEGRANLPLDQARAAVNVDDDVPVIAVDARRRESVKGAVLSLLHLILARARTSPQRV